MKEKTLRTLARVQAARERTSREALQKMARACEEVRSNVVSVEIERVEVIRSYCDGPELLDLRLRAHAEAYVETLESRGRELADKASGIELLREEERTRYLRVTRKSEVIARRLLAFRKVR